MASPFVLGLTGGIGSGKSAVSDLLAAQGAAVVDTDVIARALTAPGGAAMEAIRNAFGDAFVTPEGALDRAAMRQHVFDDALAKARLEAILHPLIRARAAAAVTAAAAAPYVVLVVPLLIEAGHWCERCDRIAVVDCDESVQLARVMARSGLNETQVRAIMASQAGRAERRAVADELIDNNGDFDSLRGQVTALHRRCLLAAQQKAAGAVL